MPNLGWNGDRLRRNRWDRESWAVFGFAACISVAAFLYYFHRGQILLYGDAEGHINIARRVFDSRTPGPLQLGTVWLPLPHLLMMPFLVSDWAWRTAVGGSIPSMIAYVLSALGIFRLVRSDLERPEGRPNFAAWFAVLVYAGNPSLIYLQATAMTEPLYLALFIWATVHLLEFARAAFVRDVKDEEFVAAQRSLFWCSLCLTGCTLTRYDGWIAMATASVAVVLLAFRPRRKTEVAALRKPILQFLLVCATGPTLWLTYNAAVYRNPLEFANGPYSAKAIERRIVQPPHPGTGNPFSAELYFMRAVEMNLASNVPVAKLWLLLAAVGTLLVAFRRDFSGLLFILWLPLLFYALTIAYSGVPVFVPAWWPFGQYNLRYGVQLLPAVAVFSAVVLNWMLSAARSLGARRVLVLTATGLWFLGAVLAWRCPASLLEATRNMQGRVVLQERLAQELLRLPRESSILMALRDFPGAPQRAGVPLRRLIDENDQRLWIRPYDPEGLWQRTLSNPSQFVDYAVGFAGDPVDDAAEQHHLPVIFSVEIAGQPRATIYRAQ
jgi:hypothetical protein